MRPLRALLVLLLLSAGVALLWRTRATRTETLSAAARGTAFAAANSAATAAAAVNSADEARAQAAFNRAENLRRHAYAQAWDEPLPVELAAFREWTRRYRAAPAAARGALEAEGVALARNRRATMRDLIIRDPARALAVTVPAAVRATLPAALLAELETRHAGTGEFALQAMSYEGGRPEGAPTQRRTVFLDRMTFTAHAYGRRSGQPTKEGASLHGIALDGHFALHESPLRVLEPGEAIAGLAGAHCPISEEAVADVAPSFAVNEADLNVVEAHGRLWEFCGGANMLDLLWQRLIAAEERSGPRVAGLTASGTFAPPSTAADEPRAWTIGTKKVLVIRVDFSDKPGEPIGTSTLSDTFTNSIRPFYEEGSYGQASMTPTITTNVYRMPQAAATYATAGNSGGLHSDARAAASADYTLADYDRLMVVFAYLGANLSNGGIANSQFTWSGLATVNGTNSWINNAFTLRTMAHELGHNHGLKHSSLWRVSDGNPLSPAGQSREYGDPFDIMGDASDRDARHHFHHWNKNLLGWLPDSAVTNVTSSGTYRIYRYDHKDASRAQPLALRVFRDGVRWYWVGYRQNFPTNSSLTGGANILWGFNALQESQLIDINTPGNTPLDSALAVGATLDDAVAGVRFRTVGRGGTAPNEWLEVEVTLPAAPPRVVASWGGNQNFLDVPTAVTYVPFDLTGATAIAAGTSHALALKANGTVVAWGDNSFGQSTVPQMPERVIAVAAGGNVSGVVKQDGTIQLWGPATNGMITPPAGLAGVRQLSIGLTHVLALKTDGTVVAWGSNTSNQLNVPANLTDVTQVAAGDRISAALKSDGTVVRWGATFSGVSFPTGLSGVTGVSASGSHVLAVKSDGTVVAWGNNVSGQSTVPAGLNNVVAVAAGEFHSLALKSDGTVVAWGSNTSGKLNVPSSLPRVSAIEASGQASFALVGPGLYILNQPANQTLIAGAAASLSVSAQGAGALTYQWRKDGVPIAGATGATLNLASVAGSHAGAYDVIVSDGTTTRTTFPAQISVAASANDISRIANLSILTSITASGDSFTMGYVVGGSGTSGAKPLVIRAAGPSLGALGVGGTISDPKIELFAGVTKTSENDNWGGAATVSTGMAAVGAFAFTGPASLDAAVLANITQRDNSVKVSGVGTATGTVIAEIYDATPSASFTATVPRLLNVSVLKNIGSGLTAGFVVAGPPGSTKNVLIRAVGPTLGAPPFNIAGVVANPQVVLYGANQTVIGGNDNWGGTAALTAAFTAVGAFGLSGATSQDAALLANLQPGPYSVLVTGVNNTTGIALVEVYEVP